MSVTRDPYDVLGVSRTATLHQIHAAYVERARRVHPDLVGPRGLDGMRALNEAWATLKDAARRGALDAEHGGAPTTGQSHTNGAAAEDSNLPFWTGAAGPPPGRPSGPVLDFGIYAGWSLGEISRRDGGYLMWLRDRPEARAFRADIVRLLDPDAAESAETRRDRR